MPPVTPSRMRLPCISMLEILGSASPVIHVLVEICLSSGGRNRITLVPNGGAGMAIRDWPEHERPREKLLANGPGGLTDAELLAVLFGSGCRGKNAVDLSGALLREFGSLRGLLTADRGR